MSSYYEILGVDKNANKEEIKKAYNKINDTFRKERRYPDKIYKEAYNVLRNTEKRSQYDDLQENPMDIVEEDYSNTLQEKKQNSSLFGANAPPLGMQTQKPIKPPRQKKPSKSATSQKKTSIPQSNDNMIDQDIRTYQINVLACIFGHGGMVQTKGAKYYVPPRPHIKEIDGVSLNIIGIKPSGICAIISPGEEQMLETLFKQNANNPFLFEQQSEEIKQWSTKRHSEKLRGVDAIPFRDIDPTTGLVVEKFFVPVLKRADPSVSLYGYKEKYGEGTEKRGDKVYTGLNTTVEIPFRHPDLTNNYPLVRIINTILTDSAGQIIHNYEQQVDLITHNNIKLSEIMQKIMEEVETSFVPFLKTHLGESSRYHIKVNLYDHTCNYFESRSSSVGEFLESKDDSKKMAPILRKKSKGSKRGRGSRGGNKRKTRKN